MWARSDSPRAASRSKSVAERGHGEAQAIARARRIGLARGGEQALEMREVLDRLAGVVAADVPGDLVGAGDEAHGGRAGEQRERAPDVRVRNRIADCGRSARTASCRRRRRASPRSSKGWAGSGKSRGCSCAKTCGDGLIALLGMRALMRDVVAPAAKLRVQIVDIGKRPRGKERIAEVLNLALDLALSHSRARAYRAAGAK